VTRRRLSATSVVVAGLALALALAFVVSPHASSAPDGLEKVAAERSIDAGTQPHALAGGPLAGYSTRGVHDTTLSTGLAGVIGVAATFLVAGGSFACIRRLGARRARAHAVRVGGPTP
jgi:cobalt/nickel transport system permease protein